jgi:hypothetical protein
MHCHCHPYVSGRYEVLAAYVVEKGCGEPVITPYLRLRRSLPARITFWLRRTDYSRVLNRVVDACDLMHY